MIAAILEGKLARAEPGAHGACPECRMKVYARTPTHAIRHWAHAPLPDGQVRDCSRDAGEMSEWHRAWQAERVDLECIEVAGEGHRADVINTSGYVVEFQRSTITPEEITARERYWKRGCWVLDGTPHDDGEPRVLVRRRPDQPENDPYVSFKWDRAPLILYRAHWPIWIDLGGRLIQVRLAEQARGNGWIVSRDWFIDEVVNGFRLVLRPHVVRETGARQKASAKRIGHAREETQEDLAKNNPNCTRPLADVPCCGLHAPGVQGGPLLPACQLCPSSPTYWRASSKEI